MAEILMPLPARDFDPTEAAIPWQLLRAHEHRFTFATPDGKPAQADPIMLTGRGLDPWGALPFPEPARRTRAPAPRPPVRSRRLCGHGRRPRLPEPHRVERHRPQKPTTPLILPGGHRARGMRDYLESAALQSAVAAFFASGKPVAAICHGVLLAARSKRADGRSVLYGRITTALTWALERKADRIARRTRFWDPSYYRTYTEAPGQPAGFMSVQQEVTRALARPADFRDVPARDPYRKRRMSGTARDTPADETPAFVVRDGTYVSARWPGDAATFAKVLHTMLAEIVRPQDPLKALIFDVDGTLAETEELHRAAFNAAFEAAGLAWHWDIPLYAELLKVTGGKERIAHYLTTLSAPPALDSAAIAALHRDKTARYTERVESGGLLLRPGVAALIAEAKAAGLRLAIATTTSRPNVDVLLAKTFGANPFDVIVAGDEVAKKKPAPDVYLKALRELALPAQLCAAVEDTEQGLASAHAANLRCIITKSTYGGTGKFPNATAVIEDLADTNLAKLKAWLTTS